MKLPQLRTRRPGGVLVLALALALLVVACSSSKPKAGPKSPFNPLASSTTTSTTADPNALHLPAGFQQQDTRFISLDPVTGKAQPTPPVPVQGGKATISGTVTGPSGPVGGATVRVERWVGSASGAIQVGTDGGGHFVAPNLLGGHYKVRAWLQPSLTTFTASTGFLADASQWQVNVNLNQYNAFQLQAAAPGGAVAVGQPFTVEALATQQQVDPNGVVQEVPIPNDQVTLATDPSVTATPNPAATDANGLATFTLTCTTPGGFTIQVSTANGSSSAPLPTCQAQVTTTTAPPPTVVDLPVGGTFTLPATGPYPAGVYQTTSPTCGLTWEVYQSGNWLPSQSSGLELVLSGPSRSLAALPGGPNCTYTRVS